MQSAMWDLQASPFDLPRGKGASPRSHATHITQSLGTKSVFHLSPRHHSESDCVVEKDSCVFCGEHSVLVHTVKKTDPTTLLKKKKQKKLGEAPPSSRAEMKRIQYE